MTRRTVRTMLAALAIAAVARGVGAEAPSHLEARIVAEEMSHLGAHRPGLPPEALLVPLGNGTDGVLKGHSLADEARLINALAEESLLQTVLRVGSARVAGRRLALIKLQAGTPEGAFSVADLRRDAEACLRAAFGSDVGAEHLDLWSVVPGAGMIGDQQEHRPVFSLSVSREQYLAATDAAGDGDCVLQRLSDVRYSPLFTDHACDAGGTLPTGAFADRPVAESWEQLVSEAGGSYVRSRMLRQREIEAIFNGRRDRRLVALTIDDGPHPLITPAMLQVLRERGVRATFFVVGQKVEQFPALARMTVGEGHELANHAYSNRRISELPDAEAWAEIAACDRVVRRVTGERMRWFRPPGGRCSPGGLRALASLGYAAAFWSRNTGDWRKPPPEVIVRNATQGLRAGDVILMHQGEMCSVEALPEIIERVRAMGLEPTTLSALAEAGGVIRDDPFTISRMVNGQLGNG